MKSHIEKIEKIYGGQIGAAKALGITIRHYNRIKNGHQKPTKTTEILISELIRKHEFLHSSELSSSIEAA